MAAILVTPRSVTAAGHPALDKLTEAGYKVILSAPGKLPTQDDLLRLLPGCVGYLAGVEVISAKVLEAAKELKVISRYGVGLDNVDLEAAKRLDIAVCRVVGTTARCVAELTMAHILSLVRWIPFGDKQIKAGQWQRRNGIELHGRTLGIFGCGHIGRLVAKFALGMDMKVLAYDVMPDPTFAPSPDFHFASLDEVLRQSDIISLHCLSLPNGAPMINDAAIAKMKKGVFIINTARANLIDQAALAEALLSGHVAGTSMDVFKIEPPAGDPLVASDRVVATPHIGGFTDENMNRTLHGAVDNLLAELKNIETGN